MAVSATFFSLVLLILLSFAANSKLVTSSDQLDGYLMSSRTISRTSTEKQSHLRFYWHDILSGPNPTAVQVAQAPTTMKSPTSFGDIVVIDDPLTTGPDLNSTLVGRAQGFYASAGLDKLGLLMAMNFVLTDETYNGSTIAIFGRNEVFSAVREMPIVGGSGLFRFAHGYAQARTFSFDTKTLNAVVEYNVFVNHY
jgi:Dirigent-like protein